MRFRTRDVAGFAVAVSFAASQACPAAAGPPGSDGAKGRVNHHSYVTRIGLNLPQGKEEIYVYTPPGYDPEGTVEYPVLFLLHGFRQEAAWWPEIGKLQSILDELISVGKARPMIVVMPGSYGNRSFLFGGKLEWFITFRVSQNINLFAKMLFEEIIPSIEAKYRVSARREDRAIAGLSMGGREAITIAFQHSNEFGWVGGFEPAFPTITFSRFHFPRAAPAPFRLLWVGAGVSDHFCGTGDRRFIADLTARKLPVVTYSSPGKHEDKVWAGGLPAVRAAALSSRTRTPLARAG